MICIECGTEISSKLRFCTNCMTEIPREKTNKSSLVSVHTDEERLKFKNSKGRTRIIIVVLLAIALVTVVAVWIGNINESNEQPYSFEYDDIILFSDSSLNSTELEKIDFSLEGQDDYIIETESSELILSFEILPKVEFLLNNAKVEVDDSGKGNIDLDSIPLGVSKYEVVLEKSGYMRTEYTIVVVATEAIPKVVDIPLSIDAVVYGDTNVEIHGKTNPDVVLACNMPLIIAPIIYSDGSFLMLIEIPDAAKEYPVVIIALDSEENEAVVQTTFAVFLMMIIIIAMQNT